MSLPLIMGIVNVTPDSFSDGGQFYDPESAIAHGRQLAAEGADILDIGGESTRPGAEPVSPEEEMRRVLPVVEGLRDCGKTISIDTRHAVTMQAAVEAGAGMINDVTALQGDPDSLAVAAAAKVPVCLMHMQGDPQTMQDSPQYGDIVDDVKAFLAGRAEACLKAGISGGSIFIDPGIGFGKTLDHNLVLLHRIGEFADLGYKVLLGASRKSFIEKICPDTPADRRLPGSLAAALWGAGQGVDMLRVHDVAATQQALAVQSAIQQTL